jgi:hypothetical protein
MERIAMGYLQLTAIQFGDLTPQEFQWRLQADVDRENREFERIAQLACWVMNPWLGRGQKMTVRKLLKRRAPKGED